MASMIPGIAQMEEPLPTLTYWVLCLSAMIIMKFIGPAPEPQSIPKAIIEDEESIADSF